MYPSVLCVGISLNYAIYFFGKHGECLAYICTRANTHVVGDFPKTWIADERLTVDTDGRWIEVSG